MVKNVWKYWVFNGSTIEVDPDLMEVVDLSNFKTTTESRENYYDDIQMQKKPYVVKVLIGSGEDPDDYIWTEPKIADALMNDNYYPVLPF